MQPTEKLPINANQLSEARQEALKQGISVIKMLEESGGYAPDDLIQELGRLLHIPVLTMEALRVLTPDYDKLPFAEASQHECALFSKDDTHVLAVSDPFSPNLRLWAEERFDVDVTWYLVHPAD